MPKPSRDAEAALHKLGQHLREGAKNLAQNRDKDAFRDAVRNQWEKEQEAEKDQQPAPEPGEDKQPERGGPDMEK